MELGDKKGEILRNGVSDQNLGRKALGNVSVRTPGTVEKGQRNRIGKFGNHMRKELVSKRGVNKSVGSGTVDESVKLSAGNRGKGNGDQEGSSGRGKDRRLRIKTRAGTGNRGAEKRGLVGNSTQERTSLPWVDEEFFAASSGVKE
jgi:hypothetical protein